jgi:hypothetical protein
MEQSTDIFIVVAALFGSMALAGVLLTRARSRAKSDGPESGVQVPASASRRQRRILESLEPDPRIPTLMDLVREEMAELGIEDIPGHEDISGPVLLKVYRRDEQVRQRCPHNGYGFVVTEGVRRDEATESDVWLYCAECGGTNPAAETFDE